MPTETEVKLYTPELADIAERLVQAGAHLHRPRVYERNVRYQDAAHTFLERGVVLRLRQDDRARLTYKDPGTAQDGIISRAEYETEVADFDMMDRILRQLGYQPHMVYEKYRTTYQLGPAEIVLDEMPYGNFTEIEGEAHIIEQVLGQLGLSTAPRLSASYAQLFDTVRQNMGLSFNDLTFEHFAGIAVPLSAFSIAGDAS